MAFLLLQTGDPDNLLLQDASNLLLQEEVVAPPVAVARGSKHRLDLFVQQQSPTFSPRIVRQQHFLPVSNTPQVTFKPKIDPPRFG